MTRIADLTVFCSACSMNYRTCSDKVRGNAVLDCPFCGAEHNISIHRHEDRLLMERARAARALQRSRRHAWTTVNENAYPPSDMQGEFVAVVKALLSELDRLFASHDERLPEAHRPVLSRKA